MTEATRYPGDYERALGRDVVLAPPTCCCCCCCCTLALPEAAMGKRWLARAEGAPGEAGAPPTFREAFLSFAGGVLLANLLASPLAGVVGFFGFFLTLGVLPVLFGLALVGVVMFHSVRIGLRHGGPDGELRGLLAGLGLLAVLALLIAAEVGLAASLLLEEPRFLPWCLLVFVLVIGIVVAARRVVKAAEARRVPPSVPP